MDGGGCDASVCQVINQEGMKMGARSENQAKSFKVNRIFQLGLGIFVVIGLTSGELFPGWPTINLDGLSHSVVAAELRGEFASFPSSPVT